MKVNKLLELYEMFEKKNVKLSTGDITNLSKLSDKVINFLLKTELKEFDLSYLLELFDYTDEEVVGEKYLDICKEIINSKNIVEVFEIIKVCNVYKSKYLYDFVKLMASTKNKNETKELILYNQYKDETKLELAKIIANAKNPKQVLDLVNHDDACKDYNDEVIVVLAKIIGNAKTDDKADCALWTAQDKDVIKSDDLIELVKIVANAKNCSEANDISVSVFVLESGYATQITKIVANAKNVVEARDVATELAIRKSKDLVEITKIMASTPNCFEVKELILESEVLEWPFALDIIKIMATTKNPDDVFSVAENEFVLNSKDALELVELVNAAKNPDHTSNIICELICKTEEVLKVAEIVASAKNPDEACSVASIESVIKSGHIVELTEIVAGAKNSNLTADLIEKIGTSEIWYVVPAAKLVAETKYPRETQRIALDIWDVTEDDYVKHFEVIKLIATAESHAKVKFLEALYDKNVSYDEIIAFGNQIIKGINKENINATLSMVLTGNYEKSKTPHESVVDILKSKNKYVLFTDAHKQNRSMAIKALKELEEEFPETEFDIDKTYIKAYKSKNQK